MTGKDAAPQFLMSPPDFFGVAYSINPWMDPKQWSVDDLVFTASCAVVLDGKAVLARYLNPERVSEEAHGLRMFERLKARGAVDVIYRTPPGVYFEGAGDAIYDPKRGIVWMGYGQRSCRFAHHTVEQAFGIPTVSLDLVDPRYCHLDTAFSLLSGGEILYHPAAFTEEGRDHIHALGGGMLIEAPVQDAAHLGANAVCIGRDMVLCDCSAPLRALLAERGYRVHVVPLGSFNRSGRAAYCLALKLNNLYKGREGRGEKLAA